MTVAEVAAALNRHPSTIYRWIDQREFPAQRLGGRLMCEREAVQHWLDTQPP